ncbi:hypothetical protein CK203_075047 [Vitis vinifera]|uniref:Uncharacterized protein n=2 Tax=Vitis vinifera TaxID=29760 RepID=A0A438F9N2_VITVI|nr:hypothetical protein CK203_075047 [Vitis vinifera]
MTNSPVPLHESRNSNQNASHSYETFGKLPLPITAFQKKGTFHPSFTFITDPLSFRILHPPGKVSLISLCKPPFQYWEREETISPVALWISSTMESHIDKPHKKSRSHNKSKRDKSPTRLQKRAPKSLQLDIVVSANPFQPSAASSHTVIPFLSPLILTPPPLPTTGTDEAIQRQSNEKKAVPPPSGGWQHPAVVALPEPSSLYNVFQSQCMLLNNL